MERPKDKVYVIHGCQHSMGRSKTVSLSFKLKDGNTVSYGISTVHSLDSFVKAKGRELSGSRLQQAPEELTFSQVDLYEVPTKELIAMVADELRIGYRNKGEGRT